MLSFILFFRLFSFLHTYHHTHTHVYIYVDYLALSQLRTSFPSVPIMALTATANEEVVRDSIRSIGMRNPFVHKQSFNRVNLSYSVRKKEAKGIISDIAAIVDERSQQTGIIYCLSKKDTEEVCTRLMAEIPRLKGKVTFYHAGVEASERERRQRLWSSGDIKVICATIGFLVLSSLSFSSL